MPHEKEYLKTCKKNLCILPKKTHCMQQKITSRCGSVNLGDIWVNDWVNGVPFVLSFLQDRTVPNARVRPLPCPSAQSNKAQRPSQSNKVQPPSVASPEPKRGFQLGDSLWGTSTIHFPRHVCLILVPFQLTHPSIDLHSISPRQSPTTLAWRNTRLRPT